MHAGYLLNLSEHFLFCTPQNSDPPGSIKCHETQQLRENTCTSARWLHPSTALEVTMERSRPEAKRKTTTGET